ncbi:MULTISPECIES: glycosyltransferase [Clostridium]|uniref:glycosyltransferase n=1 Tax=Clostridium TaxID=1485 RepID=UPI002905539A|nr:glycosyltransferase [Clostridium sp.]MDU1277988.1 glycosyltransferase [Clostridium sp.]MDU7087068.1 glycosyltransferase [Clostridium sp.]
MDLAPVVIFTFNRLDHTKRTIEALKENYLAQESELIIFSDGPRNEQEKLKVNEVREFIKNINGFKRITVIESEINKGLANSVIDGVTEVINKYGKVIVLEDDLLTSKYFLEYMNNALELYKDRNDIWSISGYTPNIDIPNEYKDEVYLIRRGASWGWATWNDRWKLNDWDIKDYRIFKKNKKMIRKFNLAGSDMAPMLNDQMEGRINSWAIRWGYNQYKFNMWTVYPIRSYVSNIGTDLSGTHSSKTKKYDVEIYNNKIDLNIECNINKEIIKEFKRFYDLNFIGYIGIIIKKIGLYKEMKALRNIILKHL